MVNDNDVLKYLRDCLSQAPLVSYPFAGEDRNLRAFRSRQELVEWYSQPPGKRGESYRDRAFYCRELAMLSMLVKPKTIVEFGTSLGIGTCLLHWLNPNAKLVTVDVNDEAYLPEDIKVTIGYLSKHQLIPCEYIRMPSWDYEATGKVDLCFIDADHSHEAVARDSLRAWENKSSRGQWAIAWHDYNEQHPGVMDAVNNFCNCMGIKLQSRGDSDTVWIIGGEENFR